jgi:hypothetical protein
VVYVVTRPGGPRLYWVGLRRSGALSESWARNPAEAKTYASAGAAHTAIKYLAEHGYHGRVQGIPGESPPEGNASARGGENVSNAVVDPRAAEAQRLLEQKGYRGQAGEHGSVLTGEQLVQRYESVFQQQPGWSAEECADAIEDALICDSQ